MPITWITSLVGSLALIGTPFLSGFYSKDSIIEAVALSHIPGAGFAYFAVMAGVFVTAFYSFRMYFLVFHGEERFGKSAHDEHHDHHGDHDEEEVAHDHHHGLAPGQKPHETPWVVTLPLVLLAIPSLLIGYIAIGPMVFGDFFKMTIPGTGNIPVILIDASAHPAMAHLSEHFHGAAAMGIHALTSLPFGLALAGVVLSWFFYMKRPDIPAAIQSRFSALYTLLDNKYYFDKINEVVFAGGARLLGKAFWRGGDVAVIDGVIVDGSARLVSMISAVTRTLQTGYVYHYAFTMIIGVFVLMTLWLNRAA
jgi:NADH-quinone oxidoreductase subunit L